LTHSVYIFARQETSAKKRIRANGEPQSGNWRHSTTVI
jgi:hypothetical protein